MKRKILLIVSGIIIVLTVAVLLILVTAKVPDTTDRNIHESATAHIDKSKYDSGRYHFPDNSWTLYENPEALGWDNKLLKEVGEKADSLETAALMIIHKGVLVYDWGATDEKYLTQSMRKGLLNSLYGIYWDKDKIDLDATLTGLNIQDEPVLTKKERTATIEQLLNGTSGVYHSALYELGEWKREKPGRGTHKPGEKWYYNNWGFNALGTIFEDISDQTIGEAFETEIAGPLQMQDFYTSDVEYLTKESLTEKLMGNSSLHNAYMFSISTRDLARYGLLYLNKGKWKDEQIISEEWINKTWKPIDIEVYQTLKFGYLWWMFEGGQIFINYDSGFEDDIYFTSGNRGHFLFVIPYLDLVVVHRVHAKGIDFFSQMKRGMFGLYADVDDTDVYKMLETIRKAHPRYKKENEININESF